MSTGLVRLIIAGTLDLLFLQAPVSVVTPQRQAAFETLFAEMCAKGISGKTIYLCEYPKHEFLSFILRQKDVLLHGSQQPDLEVLLPKEQTDCSGRNRLAVFASGDGIWPIFFAIVNRTGYRGSFRNGCFVIDGKSTWQKRFYFFSLNAQYCGSDIWQEGTLYILPKAGFTPTDQGLVRFDEWCNPRPVVPLAKMSVSAQDFPFLRNVTWHDEKEKIWTTWLRYKKRQGSQGKI